MVHAEIVRNAQAAAPARTELLHMALKITNFRPPLFRHRFWPQSRFPVPVHWNLDPDILSSSLPPEPTRLMKQKIHSTTILCVRRNGKVVMAGDGQVTFGQEVLKASARKLRRLYQNRILAGF